MSELVFGDNAYFYLKKQNISSMDIKAVFENAIVEKEGNVYCRFIKEHFGDDSQNSYYSLLAYKRKIVPSCLHIVDPTVDDRWLERRFAYLLIVEYDNYVAICKSNIPTIRYLRQNGKIVSLDADLLRNVFYQDGVQFQRFGMSNLDVSEYAMRNKSVEADNLEKAFPALGANSFVLNSYRIRNNDESYSVTIDRSKINQLGMQKVSLNLYLDWVVSCIKKIEHYNGTSNVEKNFTSIFAQKIDYKTEYLSNKLKPTAVFIQIHYLLEDSEISSVVKSSDAVNVENANNEVLDLQSRCKDIYELFSIENEKTENSSKFSNIKASEESKDDDITISVSERGIEIDSDFLMQYMVFFNDENLEPQSLLDYIRDHGYYVILFEDPRIKYSHGELYRDNKLLGNIDAFLKVFEATPELLNIVSEKGNSKKDSPKLNENSDHFPTTSLFGYVENKYSTGDCILVCDDFGTEFADHIRITKESVTFFASKHKKKCYSPTSFQEIVGQVQKNLGSFFPLEAQFKNFSKKWQNFYRINDLQTKISRVRTAGKTANNAIELWKEAIRNPNYRREVYLVIDFLSLSELKAYMGYLKDEMHNVVSKHKGRGYRNESVALLWLLSSLVSACQNMNIGIHITCQP